MARCQFRKFCFLHLRASLDLQLRDQFQGYVSNWHVLCFELLCSRFRRIQCSWKFPFYLIYLTAPLQNFRSIFHHRWVFSEISRRSNTPKRQLNRLQNNKEMKNSSFWLVFIVMHIAFPFSNFFFENNRKMALLVSSHLGRLNS